MANRRPGSIGSGSTGSTSRSLDPKAQRNVDALLGISRHNPPRDKHRDKSKEKVRDPQDSEPTREHGRGLLGGSLFKRSTKKEKPRDQASTSASTPQSRTRNVFQRHTRPPDSGNPLYPLAQSGSSLSVPPMTSVSPRSAPSYPQHQYQTQPHPATRSHRDVSSVASSRLSGRPISDSSNSDISIRRALSEHPSVEGLRPMGLQHHAQQLPPHIERTHLENSPGQHIKRKHRPQDLDLSHDKALAYGWRPDRLSSETSPYADGRSSRGDSVELQRHPTQSSTHAASYWESPDSVGRVRRSHEHSPRHPSHSPKFDPFIHPNGAQPSIRTPREQSSLTSFAGLQTVADRASPAVVEPESEDDEQGDVLSFAQATAGLGPDIGFNAPQPLAVSYPPDELFNPALRRQLPFRPGPPLMRTTLETQPMARSLGGQPSPHQVSPIQRPVSQVPSPVPEMWLGGGSGVSAATVAAAIEIPPWRQVSTRRLSFISVLRDAAPPESSEMDEELPDYAASQAQAQAAGRAEAARRARELQRRWQQGSQMRGGT